MIQNEGVPNPDFIEGVYNYCDRWCERCPLTRRCLSYAMMEKRKLNDPALLDLHNPEFWEKLRETFQETKEECLRTVAEHGIALKDLEDPKLIEEVRKHEEKLDRLARKHDSLLQKARAYLSFVSEILERDEDRTDAQDGSITEEPPPEGQAAIVEAFEIISYYHAFIYVKLSRAVHSRAEEEIEKDQYMRELSSDADGSAKVVLIAIDRSWLAWGSLLHHLEEGDGVIFKALTVLTELRDMTEQTFPGARGFVRPGFDEQSG